MTGRQARRSARNESPIRSQDGGLEAPSRTKVAARVGLLDAPERPRVGFLAVTDAFLAICSTPHHRCNAVLLHGVDLRNGQQLS
jgi:hypothetical protein